MELFESDQDLSDNTTETTVSVEPEPRPKTAIVPVENEHGQSWPQIIAAILIAIVLIVLIVLLARWIYHRTHQNSTSGSNTGQKTTLNSPSAKNQSAAPNSNSHSSSPNPSSPSPSSTPNPSNPSPSSSNNQKISNTGPGNVVAIFVGTSLVAAGLHFMISVRRFNRS
jgi:cytoskeletal protein RodZ